MTDAGAAGRFRTEDAEPSAANRSRPPPAFARHAVAADTGPTMMRACLQFLRSEQLAASGLRKRNRHIVSLAMRFPASGLRFRGGLRPCRSLSVASNRGGVFRSWPARSRRIGSPAVRPPASGRGDAACDFRPKVLRPGRNRARNSLFNGFPPGGNPCHQTYIVYSL